jgi:hypothetical protein
MHLHLYEQKRQIGVLQALAQKARYKFYMPQDEDKCENIIVDYHPSKLVESFINHIDIENVIDHRYICYQNKEADYINNRVRTHLYNTPDPYVPNELVILGQTVSSIGDAGDLVRVASVSTEYIERGTFTGKLRDLTLQCYKLNINGTEVYTFDRNMWYYIEELHKSYVDEIVELKKHNRFERVHELNNEILDINKMFIKLNYGYACTVHKAQGASIENVYVNTLSLGRAPNKRALMYVALSRPMSNIHVLTPSTS